MYQSLRQNIFILHLCSYQYRAVRIVTNLFDKFDIVVSVVKSKYGIVLR